MSQEYQDVLETNAFIFKSLQKVRLISPENVKSEINLGRWLTISSQLQIGIAVQGGNSFVSFVTADIHKLSVNKQNINQEFTNLPKKIVNVHAPEASIVTVQVNCDGSQLGVLINTKVGPFVYIYDVRAFSPQYTGDVIPTHEIRIGSSPDSKGLAFEWNTVISDIFAATGSDKTVIVTKVDFQKNGAFSMVGEKVFGAPVGVISWSPKGKQLTVGDDIGKIIQLKPELDVVRSTMAQTELGSPKVVGLFWLATTEWVVAYGRDGEDKMDTGILTIKKDKSITMHRLVDLQFGMRDAKRSAGFYGIALGEWNVIVSSSNRLSEVVVIGKEKDHWQTWQLDESCRFDLPCATGAAPTYPIGIAIDRSSQSQIVLAEDGSEPSPPMPIVMVLTSDGVLTSAHAITANKSLQSIQLAPLEANLSNVRVGIRPANSVPQTSQSVAIQPSGGIFGTTPSAPSPSVSIFGTPSSPVSSSGFLGALSTPKPGSAMAPTTASPAGGIFGGAPKPTTSLFGGITATNSTPTATTTLFSTKTENVISSESDVEAAKLLKEKEDDAAAAAAVAAKEKAEREAAEKLKKEQELKAASDAAAASLIQKRMRVGEKFVLIEQELAHLRSDGKRLNEALLQAKNSPVTEPVQKYVREVVSQLHQLADEATGEQNMILYSLKLLTRRVGEQTFAVSEAKDAKNAILLLKEHDTFDRDERMKRLEERLVECKTQFAETKKVVDSIKTLEEDEVPILTHRDAKTDAKMMDVLSRMSICSQKIRVKEDRLERDIRLLERQRSLLNSGQRHETTKATEYEIIENVSVKCDPSNISSLRDKMRKLCKARSSKVRRITPQITDMPQQAIKENKSDLSRVQKLLGESLRVSPSSPEKSSNVIKFTVATQSPDPRDFAQAAAAAATEPLPNSTFVVSKPAVPASPVVPQTPAVSASFKNSTFTVASNTISPSIGTISGGLTIGTPKTETKTTTKSIFGNILTPKSEDPTKPSIFGTPSAKEIKEVAKPVTSLFGGSTVQQPTASPAPEVKSSDENKPPAATEVKNENKIEKIESAEPKKSSEENNKKNEVSVNETVTLPNTTLVDENNTATSVSAAVTASETATSVSAAATASETKAPVFSLGGTPVISTPSITATSTIDSDSKPTFSFAGPNATTAPSSLSSETKPTFAFAGATATSSATNTVPTETKSTFNFGQAAVTSTTPATESKPTFSFTGAAAAVASTTPSVFGGGAVTPAKSSIFGGGSAPKSSIFGGGGTGNSSVFGGATAPTTQQSTTSIFGGSANKGSIFGGATSTGTSGGSIFGGGSANNTAPAGGNVAFSFKKPDAPPAAAAQTSAFNFNKPAGSGNFAAAAAAAAVPTTDDGMMEDAQASAPAQQSGSFFGGGGGFMSGLGASNTASNTGTKNIFGGGMNVSNPGQSSSWLFKGGSNSQAQAQSPQSGGGIFGGGSSAKPQGSSIFGGSPAFGAKPVFGAKPSFGGSPAGGSVFGGGQAAPVNSGFSAFAGKSAGFGGLASPQQPQQTPSVFGGSTSTSFGSKPSGSFSSWR